MVGVRVASLLLFAGCANDINYFTDGFVSNGFSGDQYPINVDTTSGAIVVGLQPDDEAPNDAVLDVLSPLTVLDQGQNVPPSISDPPFTILGARTPGAPLDLPRAHFDGPQVITLHPCTDDVCSVGEPAKGPLRPFTALLGMSAFGSDALRLHLDPAAPQIFILPDIGGDESHRTLACDAVLSTPFRGGGTMLIGGTEVQFTNWRIAIDTCLDPKPDPNIPQRSRGTDVLLVASTGVGISVLDESAYNRYREGAPIGSVPDLDTLPPYEVFLPSGPIDGRLAMIPKLALVGNSGSNPRAPCRQVYASHVLGDLGCQYSTDPSTCPCALPASDPMRPDTCPCTPDSDHPQPLFCGVPAIVELAPPQQLSFLIVSDDDPTIQALRAELRSDRPEVDGILGADALASVELDVDRPHDRLLGRCLASDCSARPELSDTCELSLIQPCLGLPQNDAVTQYECSQ
jgi:hypothetical protein